MWVVEFQKRGLPHSHILIILAANDHLITEEHVNSVVTAELPPDPNEPGISTETRAQRKPLWDTVLSNMVHGPCGVQNPNSPCMENGVCSKRYPKDYQERTIVDADSSHPVYHRRSPENGALTTIKILCN